MEKSLRSSRISISDNVEFKLESFIIPNRYRDDLKSVLIPRGLVSDRIKCLAQEVFKATGDERLVLLCVLKGSHRFFAEFYDELARIRASCEHQLDVEFIRIKSYVNSKSSDTLQFIGLANAEELQNKNVLIVEDIVDKGVTMSHLLKTLEEIGVKQKWTVILLSKRCKREVEVQEDFVGFDVPDKFVVGFGLDYNEVFRDMDHICTMSDLGVEKYTISK